MGDGRSLRPVGQRLDRHCFVLVDSGRGVLSGGLGQSSKTCSRMLHSGRPVVPLKNSSKVHRSVTSSIEIQVVDSIEDVPADAWNALAGSNPFVQHAYLSAMHVSGCASKRSGWQPLYLLMRRQDALIGAMPLYLKSHSRGVCL